MCSSDLEELDIEEELQSREVFELVRVSERLECERVQLSDSRKQAERQRREVQNVKREDEATVSTKKSAASTFAHTYVGDVVSDVFENLDGAGFFFDPLIREIEEVFLPWLEQGVHANISMAHDNEKAVQEVVGGAVALQNAKRQNAAAEYEAMQAAMTKAEDDRVAEEARLLQEMEAAAAAAAEEARLAAAAEEEAAQAAAAAEAEAEGEAAAE